MCLSPTYLPQGSFSLDLETREFVLFSSVLNWSFETIGAALAFGSLVMESCNSIYKFLGFQAMQTSSSDLNAAKLLGFWKYSC